jgi:hypothetical protein
MALVSRNILLSHPMHLNSQDTASLNNTHQILHIPSSLSMASNLNMELRYQAPQRLPRRK